MIIKCKMCGGDIAFIPGATYGTCEYCGSTSTIPQANDESKLNRYNRANHFRRQCEFDKALSAYEKLLEQDDADAEAHWGAVISRYGIEYVEDPVTRKRIPTCHRVQVASILADADYLSAVENAPDSTARDLYKQQATEIAEIQKGILAISANEKPYDVFICYKETDENCQRTRDSQWAQEVYYGLTEQGYKVFFSRITLEDKLGQQYEPYIFAALNSARVMVVIGSKPEYFNAVWVKNEWSRYLALMAQDRKRLLIPCYRGMDPYDLPEELSTLQSQDMGKIGFMQDLLRGVKKVLDADKKPEAPKPVQQSAQPSAADAAAPGVASLMGRTYLFMEDGDFASAAEYLNRVLDIDPTYAPAYAAKVCVACGFRKESELGNATFVYEDNADWQKAMRFANAQQKAAYEGYIAAVKERVAVQIRNYAYDCAVEMAVNPKGNRSKLDSELSAYEASCTRSNGKRADGSRRQNSQQNEDAFRQAVSTNEPGEVSEQGLEAAADMFDAIGDAEAAERARQCRTLAEVARRARQKIIYDAAVLAYHNRHTDPIELGKIAEQFLTVSNYMDAKAQAQKCLDEVEAIRAELYREAVEAMQAAGNSRSGWHKARLLLNTRMLDNYRDVEQLRAQAVKRYDECVAAAIERARRAAAAKKKIAAIVSVIAIAAFLVITQVIIPGNNYKKAVELRAAGQYAEAVAMFTELGDYSDAAEQIAPTYYAEGEAKRSAGDWSGAVTAFTNAGDYSDAATQITETYYQHAKALLEKSDYAGAAAIFIGIKSYKDVDNLILQDHNLAAAAAQEPYTKVGNIVTYGHYEQDNNTSNGTEAIEWIVIKYDSATGRSMLLSRYGLDAHRFDASKYQGWDKSEMRSWLNSTFLNNAFTSAEQAGIATTTVKTGNNAEWVALANKKGWSSTSLSGGADTHDKVFLLSLEEAMEYGGYTSLENFYNNGSDKMKAIPTEYAIAQGAYQSSSNKLNGTGCCWWWLRSPGYSRYYASYVSRGGRLSYVSVDLTNGSVRPAFWLNLDSGIF